MEEKDVYRILTERMGVPESKWVHEVWKLLVTPEEGRMLLELPAFPEELAEKFSLNVEKMREILEDWVLKGIVIPLRKDGKEKFALCRGVVNFFESASHGTYKMVGEEVLDLWAKWLQTEYFEEVRKYEQAGRRITRVFPFRDAIKDDTGIRPEEDIRLLVEQSHKIVAVECPCRLVLKKCNHTVECCLLFDRGAEVALRRKTGRELSKNEALEMISACVKEGLIPAGGTQAKINNLCLCCTDCCLAFKPFLSFDYQTAVPSRYLSAVNLDLCNGCQTCVEMCPFSAVEMGKATSSKKLKAQVDPDKCYGCGVCVPNCSQGAMELKLVRPVEHLPVA